MKLNEIRDNEGARKGRKRLGTEHVVLVRLAQQRKQLLAILGNTDQQGGQPLQQRFSLIRTWGFIGHP